MEFNRELAVLGKHKVDNARMNMPGLINLEKKLVNQRPFQGVAILGCVTPTIETGAFVITLRNLGAELSWCSDNQFGSHDDIVAYINSLGISLFGRANMTLKEHHASMEDAINAIPVGTKFHIIDDGGDITKYMIEKRKDILSHVRVISEQTTCGITAIRGFYARGLLEVPVININDCFSKREFDNYYGVQESLVKALMQVTTQIASKRAVIFGYGPVGKGAAVSLRNLGARVAVVEADLLRLLQAHFDGFEAKSLEEALTEADICVTATGCIDVIKGQSIEKLKDGVILCNIGHGTGEYDVQYLEQHGEKVRVNQYVDAYTLQSRKIVYSLCHGALANIIAGGGNPPRVMSLTFTLHALAHLDFLSDPVKYGKKGLHALPREFDVMNAELNAPQLNERLYQLSPAQKRHLKPDE